MVGLAGKMDWQQGVEEAVKKVSERSDDGWIVTLVRLSDHTSLSYLHSPLTCRSIPRPHWMITCVVLQVWLIEVGNPHNQHWRYSSTQVRSLQAIGACLETTSKVPLLHILFLPHTSTGSFSLDFSTLGIPKYIPSK